VHSTSENVSSLLQRWLSVSPHFKLHRKCKSVCTYLQLLMKIWNAQEVC